MNMFSKKEKETAAHSAQGRNRLGDNAASAAAAPQAPAQPAPNQPQPQMQMPGNTRVMPPQAVPVPATQNRQPITVIGKGTLIEGNIETASELIVEGHVKGDIITQGKIILGPSSKFEGNILAQNAEIGGNVVGKVEVSELLVLKTNSDVNGDISTNKLHVESGAKFNGGCQMGVTRDAIQLSNDSAKPASSTSKPEVKSSASTTASSSNS